jgi:AcrR family transcriptional regulator
MARTLDREAHALRRDEFIDAAQRLIASKGYEQMSVQEMLDELGASKGAFYHYFDSKEALLSAVVERLTDAGVEATRPVAEDPTLTAVEKMDRLFSTVAAYKAARKDLLIALLDVWFSDANVMVRDRFRRGMVDRLTPLFAGIIRQGQTEGTFVEGDPTDVARVLVSFMQGVNEQASDLFLARQAGRITFDEAERALATTAGAFERILGLPGDTLTMLDRETLITWYG